MTTDLTKLSDDELLQAAIPELEALDVHRGVPIHVSGVSAMQLIGQLQLALRHPLNGGPSAKVAQEIIDGLTKEIGQTPAIGEMIRRGFRRPQKAPLKYMTEPQIGELMTAVAHAVDSALKDRLVVPAGRKTKFVALVFEDPALTQYVSSCAREDIIKAMRETAERLERGDDVERRPE